MKKNSMQTEYIMHHTEKKSLKEVLSSSFFGGWLIFLLLTTALSTVLYLVVLANITGESYFNSSLLTQCTYLLFQFLMMVTATFSALYLFLIAKYSPLFLIIGYTVFADMSVILPLSKKVYWNKIIWDELWIENAWSVFWSYCSDYVPPFLFLVVTSLLFTAYMHVGPLTKFGCDLRKKGYDTLLLIGITVFTFWLFFVWQETFSGVLPYLEDIEKGDSHMRPVDAAYIVFKYLFYTGTAVALFFAGKKLHCRIEEDFSSSES